MKKKNFTFEYTPAIFNDIDHEVAIDFSGDDYVLVNEPSGRPGVCLFGPAVDRLHEFEKLNMEPKEIETLIKNYEFKKRRLDGYENLGYTPEQLKELLRKRKDPEPVDIRKLIDEVREKKDCSVHIFMMGNGIKSIDIKPFEDTGMPRWIMHNGRIDKNGVYIPSRFTCPTCGNETSCFTSYCSRCGEQLGMPVESQPKKMTCREKLQKEHPDKINAFYAAGCAGCPHKYGYAIKPDDCSSTTCDECWDREVEE